MGNPMTPTEIVVKSYADGAAKLGTPVCKITHPDDTSDFKIIGAAIQVGGHPSFKPGQVAHAHGSTIANPQRSDKEVEAILGEKRYDPKPDPRSKEEMMLRNNAADGKIEKLEAMILQQGQIIQAYMAGQNNAPQNTKPIENNSEPVTETVTKVELSMAELRAKAKEYEIKAPVGTTKVALIELIERAERVRKAS